MENNHVTFLKICDNLSNLSYCSKYKVGSLLIKDNNIICSGVNETIHGYIKCCDKFHNCNTHIEPYKTEHREWAEKYELHAELSVLTYAAKNSINTNNSILYCNLEPCSECFKHIINAGIKEIYYSKKHKLNLESEEIIHIKNMLKIKIEFIDINE